MLFINEASRQRALKDIEEDHYGLRADHYRGVRYSGMVDIGAECGLVSLAFKMLHPMAEVIAVEPDTKTFNCMMENLAGLDITCMRRSLGDGRFFGQLPPTESFSTLPEFGPNVHKNGSDSGTLPQLLDHHGGDWSGWFLKINANGAERWLDEPDTFNLLEKFQRAVIVEHPGYTGIPNRIRLMMNVDVVPWWR